MLTASTSSFPESFNYGPEDLEAMRRAFGRACEENPIIARTAVRDRLTKAIVNRFQHGIDETQLIAIALRRAH